ncbi:polyketide cyclase [Halobacteriales archaeon QS_1_68_20]|nr:MAG: polyketide cyclase [Halobacteriales archaeon QS_1_68_20]
MVEVEASQFVAATPPEIRSALSPSAIVAAEGTFEVADVEETGDGWEVHAEGRGISATFAFRETEDGYVYEQVGDHGPFEEMETALSLVREDDGTRLTMTSVVDLGLPLSAVTDRVAAWKRRAELRRALAALAEGVE